MLEGKGHKRSAAEAGLSTANIRQQREGQAIHIDQGHHLPVPDCASGQQPVRNMNPDISERGGQHRKGDDTEQGEWSIAESKSSRKKKRRKIASDFDAPPSISFLSTKPAQIQLKALQELVLYILADGVAPTWLAINNARQIQKVVVLMIPGLDRNSVEKSDIFKPSTAATGEIMLDGSTPTGSEPPSLPQGETTPADLPLQQRNEVASGVSTPAAQNPVHKFLDHLIPVKAPGDSGRNQIHSPLQTILIAPYDQPKDKRGKDEKSHPVRTAIADFIHTADELRDAEYPIHPASFDNDRDAQLEHERREKTLQSTSAGWVDTKVQRSEIPIPASPLKSPKPLRAQDSLTRGYKVYAVDCEMVLTDNEKFSLARISILDWAGKTVLDKYVKPSLPIKNYFTQFSGITPQILEGVTTTLQDIQQELLSLLSPDSILLGHSLESDLNALQLTHPHIIDTSIIYPHPRGLPLRSSLKYLANKYLKREIQKGGADGHDSVEDALAVLDLVRMKCEKGPRWGTLDANGESIFRRISRALKPDDATPTLPGKMRQTAIVEYGTPERGFGKDATYKIACEDDDEIVAGVLRAAHGDDLNHNIEDENGCSGSTLIAPANDETTKRAARPSTTSTHQHEIPIPTGGADFIWGRLRDLEAIRGWNTAPAPLPENPPPSDLTYTAPASTTENPQLEKAITQTLTRLAQLYTALPPQTLLIVYNGTGDMRPVLKLQQLHAQYRREFKVKKWDELSVKWTDVEEQALRRAVDDARRGWGVIAVR
ncbi:uncharacterized protein A1O9_04317 [Exophiala aquamarina CBS 119918]|uniref:Exonuclease domain-containing protein n=1 Tax=Exophiala aquamarina CBS 119918 TaxID=1182545 RepID=A0A072PJI3_9EURO|nr:uncharacterized protein A1O9_04317 [Exophiala aquamarina CBS 119918]KEF59473.1 hypothetical protein A1O9_04317 [Exophiala aquamarina CBS 119918]